MEFLVHFIDKDVRSPDGALDAACALAELFERNTFVGYITIDSHGRVPTFQTAVYPRLPTWPFSKVHGVPIRHPMSGPVPRPYAKEGRSPVATSRPKPASTPVGVRPARNFASVRSSPLPYSASTADRLAPLSRHPTGRAILSITTCRGLAFMRCEPFFKSNSINALRATHFTVLVVSGNESNAVYQGVRKKAKQMKIPCGRLRGPAGDGAAVAGLSAGHARSTRANARLCRRLN
jgi:hypothetical protein